eukprot:scaffold23658_cov61-Phaeocystis_antarctica.AAC.9
MEIISAESRMPTSAAARVKNRPTKLTGAKSPKPTVVMTMVTSQSDSDQVCGLISRPRSSEISISTPAPTPSRCACTWVRSAMRMPGRYAHTHIPYYA